MFNIFFLERVTELKLLSVMIDKNLDLQIHIKTVESKFSKNVRVLFTNSLHLNVYIMPIIIFMQNVKYTTICRVFVRTWNNRSNFV